MEIEELMAEVALLRVKLKRVEPQAGPTTPEAGAIVAATSTLLPVGPSPVHTPEREHLATPEHAATPGDLGSPLWKWHLKDVC